MRHERFPIEAGNAWRRCAAHSLQHMPNNCQAFTFNAQECRRACLLQSGLLQGLLERQTPQAPYRYRSEQGSGVRRSPLRNMQGASAPQKVGHQRPSGVLQSRVQNFLVEVPTETRPSRHHGTGSGKNGERLCLRVRRSSQYSARKQGLRSPAPLGDVASYWATTHKRGNGSPQERRPVGQPARKPGAVGVSASKRPTSRRVSCLGRRNHRYVQTNTSPFALELRTAALATGAASSK